MKAESSNSWLVRVHIFGKKQTESGMLPDRATFENYQILIIVSHQRNCFQPEVQISLIGRNLKNAIFKWTIRF